MDHYYMAGRSVDCEWELVITGLMPDTTLHAYYHDEQTVKRVMSELPPDTEWRLFRLERRDTSGDPPW